MRSHGFISTKLDSNCKSGWDASIKAWEVYSNSENVLYEPVLIDIAKYNEFDVKVLYELIEYLRKKH